MQKMFFRPEMDLREVTLKYGRFGRLHTRMDSAEIWELGMDSHLALVL
jgi:hypothetical protein